MKTRLTIPGLKALLVPPSASRGSEVGSVSGARAPVGWRRALFGLRKTADRPLTLVDFLRQVTLFEGLDTREFRRLARIVHEREYRDGEYVCEQGKPGAALFVLRSGVVDVVKRGRDGQDESLAVLEPPASFEEWAALGTGTARWFSIRARGAVSLLALGKSDLEAMMVNFPPVANKVLFNLAGLMAMRMQLLLEAQDLLEAGPAAEREP
jgi:CRP-like cAMP-binding protein